MAFYTIFISPGLSQADYRRAVRSRPAASTSRRRDHLDLLSVAGFGRITETDLTADFLRTTRAWYEARERFAAQLRQAEGESSFRERQSDYLELLQGIQAGLFQRSLFVAQ